MTPAQSELIVRTKLRMPRPARAPVARERLLTRLAGPLSPVTIVSAPPGFGKTTLVAQLIGLRRDAVAWFHERDAVVGGGALFLDGHDAWLGMGAILPDYRRRGGQRALMTQRIRDAIAAGATRIFSETGEPQEQGTNPSLNNMERCGFVKVVTRTSFVGAPSTTGTF